jgi:hypothetical protein
LYELREYAKKTWNEDHPDDESALKDAFDNGLFHEHEPDWNGIAAGLTDSLIVNLALSAMRPMVTGVGSSEADMKAIMEFYEALNKWSRKMLKAPEEILGPLDRLREALIKRAKGAKYAWWIEALRAFSLVDLGIRGRMGLHGYDIGIPYSDAIRECSAKGE